MNQEIYNEIMKDPVNGRLVLSASFKNFISFFHWYLYRSDFIFMSFHDEIIRKIEDIAFGRSKKKNLCINMAPRLGKSTITRYACGWSYMLNPGSNCIYTSYSDDLANDFSKEIREIVESEPFFKLTGLTFKKDKKGADYWVTSSGGGFRAAPLGGGLTGYGYGISSNDFGGFGICFPYDEEVWTEKGKKKIGEIVERKEEVRVLSYNFDKGIIEYQPIEGYVENGPSDILKIVFAGGSVECTPDHYFWTERGYIKACELTSDDRIMVSTDSFDLSYSKIKFLSYLSSGVIFIKDKIKLFLGECSRFYRSYNFKGNSLKGSTTFNIRNSNRGYSVKTGDFRIRSRVGSDIDNIGSGKRSVRKNDRPMLNRVLHIIGFSSISDIFKYVVGGISVKMSDFCSFCLRTYKSMGNRLMNIYPFSSRVFGTHHKMVPVSVRNWFKNLFGNMISRLIGSRFNNSAKRFNPSFGTDFIPSLKTGYRKPLFIYKSSHVDTSYCLTVRHNHNLFVGKGQGFLAKNCDDPNKPSLVKSQMELQNTIDLYESVFKTRANNKLKSPALMIMQRVSIDDLTGYIEENESDDWEILKFPAIDEEKGVSIWEEKLPYKEMMKLKKQNPFIYYSQYQQEPIVLGGSVYKTAWFRYYDTKDSYQYQLSYMTGDTAQKKGEANDFTVLQYWGKTVDNKLHLIDMVRGKFDAEELEEQIILFWEKWKKGCGSGNFKCPPYGFYIEDKSSGIGVLQSIRKKYPLPVIPISRSRYKDDQGFIKSQDKLTRAMTAIPYIANGWVYLPNSEKDDISASVLSEAAAFRADLSHKHDDIIDCLNDGIEIAFGSTGISSIFI